MDYPWLTDLWRKMTETAWRLFSLFITHWFASLVLLMLEVTQLYNNWYGLVQQVGVTGIIIIIIIIITTTIAHRR